MSKSNPSSGDARSEQADLLDRVTATFERLGYAVTGSHASIAYGENRFTNDIDIVLELDSQRLPELLAAFPSDQFYVAQDGAREWKIIFQRETILYSGRTRQQPVVAKPVRAPPAPSPDQNDSLRKAEEIARQLRT